MLVSQNVTKNSSSTLDIIYGKIEELQELTLVSVFSGDVEAALDSRGADPDEGVSPGGGEAVVLLARVVVPDNINMAPSAGILGHPPLHAGLHPVAPVHVIVRTDLHHTRNMII